MTSSRHLLGPDGPLARALGHYEHREGQLQMTAAVERALAEDRILLCEAGTGTGKTLAYLAPALASGLRVVVSTASKTLQEQIVRKDLPLLRQCGLHEPSMLLKGLSNYVCRRRLDEASMAALQTPGPNRALKLVRDYAEHSASGDIAGVTELPETHPIWRQVASSSDTRIGTRCSYYERCFVTQTRRQAEGARLLVVNHHLFFADLAIRSDEHGGGALPPYDAVIFDEAHKLEEVAALFFGVRVSSERLGQLTGETLRSGRRAGYHDLQALCAVTNKHAQEMFARLNLVAAAGEGRVALDPRDVLGPVQSAYHALDNSLEALADDLKTRAEHESLAQAVRRIGRVREQLATVLQPSSRTVTWLERGDSGLALSAAPVEVGELLRERLYARGIALVLTSASLTTAGSFSFLRQRLGLDESLQSPVDELVVAPALDHREQALLYTPTDLPDVNDPGFLAAACKRLQELIEATPGGAFVLCTSSSRMRAIARALTASLTVTVLVQGEAPKATLLERFNREGNAVLVATMSFWEGVDVPGSALQLVAIDRIPFPVPTDPLVQARSEVLQARGQSPFSGYMLPRAAMILKQGFGRLLRTRDDRGVVAVLDRRVAKAGYGRILLASLPDARRTRRIEDVIAFWRRQSTC